MAASNVDRFLALEGWNIYSGQACDFFQNLFIQGVPEWNSKTLLGITPGLIVFVVGGGGSQCRWPHNTWSTAPEKHPIDPHSNMTKSLAHATPKPRPRHAQATPTPKPRPRHAHATPKPRPSHARPSHAHATPKPRTPKPRPRHAQATPNWAGARKPVHTSFFFKSKPHSKLFGEKNIKSSTEILTISSTNSFVFSRWRCLGETKP